tara:strand:+ start:3157 stop:3480 length:324 start_codon:yes stop_codon:yes gene_type:complete
MTMLFKKVYRVVENPYEENAGIELVSGEWEGLVYQYGDVQFVNGEPQLNFKRTIRRVPNGVEATEEVIEELLNNNELNKLMGDILVELMQEQMKREENEQRDSKTGN